MKRTASLLIIALSLVLVGQSHAWAVVTADPQTVTTPANTAKSLTLTGLDSQNRPLTYSIVNNPAHGIVTGTPPNVTYTPAQNYTGSDSFTFRVINGLPGNPNSDTGIVSITITPAAAPPTANPQSVTTAFNTSKDITLSAADPNNLPLTYSIVAPPAHGALSGVAPNITYQPVMGYSGTDSFTFKANNGAMDSNVATVSLLVNAPAIPTANSQSVATGFNVAMPIMLTGSDPIGLPLTYIIVANPAHGSLSGAGANQIYTPATNYSGSDSFTFKVNNGVLDSNTATVSLTVNAAAVPVANNQSISTPFNTDRLITLTGTDSNGLSLTYSIVTNPSHGAVSGTPPNINYAPITGYSGPDNFTFKVNNGLQDSNIATLSITIDPTTSLDPPTINIAGPLSLNDVITVTPDPCCVADYYVWSFIPQASPGSAAPTAGLVSVPHAPAALSLGSLGLHVGNYQVRVHGVVGQITSVDAVANLTLVSSTLSGLRVFPNPWRSDKDEDIGITFDHLTSGAQVKIFDMAAHWVRTLDATSDTVSWDRRNDRGDGVASGMYLYVITDNQGDTKRGKLTIIK